MGVGERRAQRRGTAVGAAGGPWGVEARGSSAAAGAAVGAWGVEDSGEQHGGRRSGTVAGGAEGAWGSGGRSRGRRCRGR